jgi:pimeloyl-ACP methyl ester carboxylesterase
VVDHFEKTFQKDPSFFSAPAFAEALELPGLIIHDEEDAETPFYHAERIHSAWKNSRLIKTKGYGHNLRSQEVVNEVIRFVTDPLSSKVPSQIAMNDHR